MATFLISEFENLTLPINEKDLHKNSVATQIFGDKIPSGHTPMLKYVALLYDMKSPLRLKIPDINLRKQECAEIAGLKNGEEDGIFDLSNDNILVYINSYLRYQSSKVWAILAANEEVLWQYQQELLTPIRDFKNDKDKLQALEIKSKLMGECDAIIKRIESYEDKIFGDNKEKKEIIRNITPESIANL